VGSDVFYILGRISLIVALLIFAICLIVVGIYVAGQLFVYFVEHGALD
jgi:hypothetical protein